MCEYVVNINISLKQKQKNLISFHIISSSQLVSQPHNHFLSFLPPPVFFGVFHMSHPSLQARQSHLWKQWVVAHCLDPATGINQNSWTVQASGFLIAPLFCSRPKYHQKITPPPPGTGYVSDGWFMSWECNVLFSDRPDWNLWTKRKRNKKERLQLW